MILLILFIVIYTKCDIAFSECTDIYGRAINPNSHFIPGPDICQLCVCDNTSPKWCKRVLCSPPQNCKSFVMGNSCCDYSCLDNTLPSGESRDEIDRKFLVTIATAFLILTVLLFIIHKLRHRTIHCRLQNRNEGRRNIGFMPAEYLNLANGHHFDDHPLVHFPIIKPNTYNHREGDAPPPYDEVIGDSSGVAYTSQLLTHNRAIHEINHQRRRSNSTGLHNFLGRSTRTPFENCVRESHPQNAEIFLPPDASNIYSCSLQHRSIPLSICTNADNTNRHLKCSAYSNNPYLTENRKSCPVHKNANTTCKNEFDEYHNDRNSNSQNCISISETRPSHCSPQIHFESSHVGIRPFQHRTLPLSASLSSPLPSTSDSCDRQTQFATFSSAVNISSSDGDEPSSVSLEPFMKKPSEKSAVTISDEKECALNNTKENKATGKGSVSKDHNVVVANAENTCKNSESEQMETKTSQLIEDYHAECENCNLNVNLKCDASDEYFSEQETMTLQRKLHEISAIKSNDQSMKVSLTLPTNSRTRRCSSTNQKNERWNVKESSFKTKLDYVSSEDEEVESDAPQVTKKNIVEDKI